MLRFIFFSSRLSGFTSAPLSSPPWPGSMRTLAYTAGEGTGVGAAVSVGIGGVSEAAAGAVTAARSAAADAAREDRLFKEKT